MELKTQWGFLWTRQSGDRYLNPLVMLSTRRARCGHKLRVAYAVILLCFALPWIAQDKHSSLPRARTPLRGLPD
jgi:hypothetical protein